jgi:hypothetical protein
MNLEQLKDKLGDEKFAELKAYVDDLSGQRDAARQESIAGRKKLKEEVETLRGIKTKLFEKLALDDDADLDSLPDGKGHAEAVKQFETKLKRLEREKAEALAQKGEIEGKYRGSRLDAALEKSLSGFEWIDRDIASLLIKNVVVWEDDQIMIKGDGTKVMTLEDGVKTLASTKPHLLKAKGAGGSGHGTNARGGEAKNPWANGSRNITEQIAMTRENPALAAQLKAAAGA